MYTIKRSEFNGQWLVINSLTGLAQSAWGTKGLASGVAKDLNKGQGVKK